MYTRHLAAAALAFIATPALAQSTDVTGTIDMDGSVAARCVVLPDGGSTFSATVHFGELTQTNGTLRTGLSTEFGTKSFHIACNSAAPYITIEADPLATSTTAPAGYDNSIDYTAHVTFSTTPATNTFDHSSAAASATTSTLNGPLVNNGSDNLSVTADTFHTDNTTDLLVASSSYSGQIRISIAPSI